MSPKLVAAAEFFETIAPRYDREYGLDGATTRARMRRVLELLPPRTRLLDLGVGTGRELSSLQDAGHTVIGLDQSETMLTICARRARPIELVRGDLWAPLPFEDDSFDAVVALHGTLAHPPDEAALGRLAREVARVVRAGGVWLAEVPSPGWLEAALSAALPYVTSTGDERCVHEDPRGGVAVEATVLSAVRWKESLAPHLTVIVEAISAVEQLVVAVVPSSVQGSRS